jgi:signal transduction histidine kinase
VNPFHARDAVDRRVLVLGPTNRDAATTRNLFEKAGVLCEVFTQLDPLILELSRGAAAILIPEEALTPDSTGRLTAVLEAQPPWSDLPVLLLTYPGADSIESSDAVRTLGNVTLLERPLQVATLVSAVRTALRARDRQYQIRGHLEERERTADSLRAADQRKDEFLATLGHELRNPLAPLLTGLQLLKNANIQDQAIQRITAVMERQVSHLVTLVNDLLEVSRITRGVIELHRGPLDLNFVVESAIDASRPVVEAAGHTLTVELPERPVTISGDQVRLAQVFTNLLTNAAKYTNAGGQIWLTVRQEGDRAIVSVRDNGIGIPPSHLRSVFEMFMQVDRSSRRAQGGLGIGLTLVRSLVTMHGGRVLARSQGVGTGSEFVVELPVLAAGQAPTRETAPLAPLPPVRILVVDDNVDAAETLGALLGSLGADVDVVHSGRAALEAVERIEPDVLLLDVGMPEMDGYEVARRLRADARHHALLLIALSGWSQEQDVNLSKASGFDHHLVKPLDLDKLRGLLRDAPVVRR